MKRLLCPSRDKTGRRPVDLRTRGVVQALPKHGGALACVRSRATRQLWCAEHADLLIAPRRGQMSSLATTTSITGRPRAATAQRVRPISRPEAQAAGETVRPGFVTRSRLVRE